MNTNLISCCVASLLMFGCVSGPRSSTATKTFILQSADGGPRLRIDLPSSFSMRRQEGPDFDVFYFSDTSTTRSMGLYCGQHPSSPSAEAGVAYIHRQPGRIGDISVEWSRWLQDGKYRSETLVHDFYGRSAQRGYAGLVLHFFTVAVTEQDVARMEAAAATLRLQRGK